MAFSLTSFLKGILLQSNTDRTVQLSISPGGTTGTSTSLAAAQTVNTTLTLPSDPANATDTLVGAASTQTLTNKTMSGSSNTFTNLPGSSISGTVAVANGGTGQTTANAGFNALSPMTTLGDIIYENGTPAAARLAGNITATKEFLSQTGTGSVSAAPAWAVLVSSDIPNNAANTTGTATNITAASNSTLTTLSALSLPGSQVTGNISGNAANVTGTVAVANGGTGDTSFTANQVILGGTTSTGALAQVTGAASGMVLTSNGATAAPTWQASGTPTFSGLTTDGAMYATSTTAIGSTAAGTNGQILTATTSGAPTWQNPINGYNFLVNGAFDYWQAGTSTTITSTGGGTPGNVYSYLADQWYVDNAMGGGTTEGIITYSQVPGATNGSLFGAKVQTTTAPVGTGIGQTPQLYQVLSNKASVPLYGQTASFSVLAKGLNNVIQVGVQFYYATSEGKLTTAIGSEVSATINSSTFTAVTINGQALGTSQTASGVIGVRIRVTGVSTGNQYDLNNGFVVEQAMLNLGPVAAPFQRQYSSPAQELAACQYFYENSYGPTVAPGTATVNGIMGFPCYGVDAGGDNVYGTVNFAVNKRNAPGISVWDAAGNTNKVSTFIGGGSRTDNTTGAGSSNVSTHGFLLNVTVPHLATSYAYHWAADSRI